MPHSVMDARSESRHSAGHEEVARRRRRGSASATSRALATWGALIALVGLAQWRALAAELHSQAAMGQHDGARPTDQLQLQPHHQLQSGHYHGQSIHHDQQQHQTRTATTTFDASAYKNLREALRAHPDLHEFATLCESEGVKEIVSMDRTPLTVFAPIDQALGGLLARARSTRPINLVELAKHHIAQGLVTPDETTKYPHKFASYALGSPLYLAPEASGSPSSSRFMVNNARILATYLLPIASGADSAEPELFHALHIIDAPLEFAYAERRAHLRGQLAGGARTTTRRAPLSLDDLTGESLAEFGERFAPDYLARGGALARDQLEHAPRLLRGSGANQRRVTFSAGALSVERFLRLARQLSGSLRGRLFAANETGSLNTYFLPVDSRDLDALEELARREPLEAARLLEAHVLADQVAFVRALPLGQPLASLAGASWQLSLAKGAPSAARPSAEGGPTGGARDEAGPSEAELEARAWLATPLLVESERRGAGISSAEIVLANVPLAHGVLHLIERPLNAPAQTSLVAYLNDSDERFSELANALGSRTSSAPASPSSSSSSSSAQPSDQPIQVSRFRELLARERSQLASLAASHSRNLTLFVPTDQAFARLRFELRALIAGDETLVPEHWSPEYRRQLLERLVKRHIYARGALTSEQLLAASAPIASELDRPLSFASCPSEPQQLCVESDGTRARLLQRDLLASDGLLHVIDRVLGEELETVHSLLDSLLVQARSSRAESPIADFNQQVEASLRALNLAQEPSLTASNSLADSNSNSNSDSQQQQHQQQQQQTQVELATISRAIGQYLDELAGAAAPRQQLQLLANSVNISYQLAKLTSLADGQDDWNERFKSPERAFTYFVPSDLAWIRLQQSQPELYRPLMHFLELKQQPQSQPQQHQPQQQQQDEQQSLRGPRSSESSHRLRQILERHLIVNRKLDRRELERLDSLQSLAGATLRLVEPAHQHHHQLSAANEGSSAPLSAFAALQSMVSGSSAQSPVSGASLSPESQARQRAPQKALKLEASVANIVQANEASNGFVYIIDNVLLLPDDSSHIVQTSSAPALSSSMSSLLGAHNSAILDSINSVLALVGSSAASVSAQSMLAVLVTLMLLIAVLVVVALALVARRRRANKLTRHQQLESGLTSASSNQSTSTTKSL